MNERTVPPVPDPEELKWARPEPILVDPHRQLMEWELVRLPSQQLVAGDNTIIAEVNPNRLALFVQAQDLSPIVLTLDDAFVGLPPSSAVEPATPIVIHAASFPCLVTLAWRVHVRTNTTVFAWEVRRR